MWRIEAINDERLHNHIDRLALGQIGKSLASDSWRLIALGLIASANFGPRRVMQFNGLLGLILFGKPNLNQTTRLQAAL